MSENQAYAMGKIIGSMLKENPNPAVKRLLLEMIANPKSNWSQEAVNGLMDAMKEHDEKGSIDWCPPLGQDDIN